MLQAHELDNTELNGGVDKKFEEGKYNDLTDGRYEKTIYVKNMDRQDDHSQDQSEAHGRYRERTDRGKDKNPERTPASREQRKGPDGQKNAEGLQHKWWRDNRNDSIYY